MCAVDEFIYEFIFFRLLIRMSVCECVCHCKVLHDLRPRVLECEGGLSEVLVDKIPQKLTRRMIDFIYWW